MPNPHRGEIAAELGGKTRTLVLTLGALAELEDSFKTSNLPDLVQHFETGKLSARDCITIIAAGLRGAGEDISDQEVASLSTPEAAAGYIRIVSRLLNATFGSGAAPPSPPPDPRKPQTL